MTETMRNGEGIIIEKDFKLAFRFFIMERLIESIGVLNNSEFPSKFRAKYEIIDFFENL